MSLKRRRSPSSSRPPVNATEIEGPNIDNRGPSVAESSTHHRIGDIFSYQEIFLRILSFLTPTELALVQSTSKYWSRMALDQQLWKRLYLSRYPHPHHSRLVYKSSPSGSSTPNRLRPIARLPSRAFPPPSPSRSSSASSIAGRSTPLQADKHKGSGVALPLQDREEAQEVGYGVRNDGVDWKVMLRLGINWSNGNALSQSTIPLPPSPSPSIRSLEDTSITNQAGPSNCSEQHIALCPHFIFTSNPASPLVHVHKSSSAENTAPLGIIPPPPGWSSPHRPDNVTAICADQAVNVQEESTAPGSSPVKVAVFHQSGGFVVLHVQLDGDKLSWKRESTHPPQNRPRSVRRRATMYTPLAGDPIVLAAMYYPTLITCTLGFHLSVYSLVGMDNEPTRPKHLSTMHSDVSFHPAALSLFPSPNDDGSQDARSFRAALTYCTPLYPASWTVAVQEFGVELDSYLSGEVWRGECYNVGRGDESDESVDIWPRKVKPIVGVKGKSAVGVGTDGRWCVLAGEDNQIQVYALPTPSPSPSSSPQKTSPILHAQTLLAHSSAVTSVSLHAGRCVSGGRDGRILVWELDEEIDDGLNDERYGRTVGYVEVKKGGRRWNGPSGPQSELEEDVEEAETRRSWLKGLPHPASISSAARSLFLPRPPDVIDDRPPAIRQIVFDEEKIVGLVRTDDPYDPKLRGDGEVMKVWSFNG